MERPLPTVLVAGPPAPGAWQAPVPALVRTFTVGDLISRTFSIWGRNVLRLLPLGLLAHAPLAVGTFILYTRMPELMQAMRPHRVEPAAVFREAFSSFWRTMLGILPYSLTTGLLSLVVLGAISHGVHRRLAGERMKLGAMIGASVRALPAVLLAVLLGWLASIPATLALFFPAVILAIGWSTAIPAIVVERLGPVAALRRSWGLTRGYRWQLFAGFLVLWMVVAAGSSVIQMPLMFIAMLRQFRQFTSGQVDPAALAIPTAVGQLVQGAAQTLLLVALAVAFQGLRAAKEGEEPEELGRIFE